MPVAFLIVSIIGALFTLNAYRPLLKIGPFSVPTFFAGWLTSELPVHHLVWQAVASAVFIWRGALGADGETGGRRSSALGSEEHRVEIQERFNIGIDHSRDEIR